MQSPSTLNHTAIFHCPYCHSPLTPHAKTWLCDGSQHPKGTNHPFDVARQGYVNLLPVQNKKSKDPGDSQASIDARHRFLTQGFYQPLQQLIGARIKDITKKDSISPKDSNKTQTWLDIGCGDGYYTQAMAEALKTGSVLHTNHLIAVDISKPAVTQLAKTFKQQKALWYQIDDACQNAKDLQNQGVMIDFMPSLPRTYPLVASASHLPLKGGSVAGICTIFSPILPQEFARVVKNNGHLIIAKPDAGHLQSLRAALFDEVRPHDSDKFLDTLAPYFELTNSHHIHANLKLDKQALSDLLTMTPYSYRAKAEKREALLANAETTAFETVAKFVVYELRKL